MTGSDPSPISTSPAGRAPRPRGGNDFARYGRLPGEAALFALVAGVYLLHLFLAGYDRFYYDAAFYWELGRSFGASGHFSLFSYSGANFHGYSLPLYCYVLQSIASGLGIGGVTIVKISGALEAATLGVLVAPRLARRLFPSATVSWGRIVAFNAVLFLLWRDYFDFPLSDFPALLLAGLGLLGLLRRTPAGYLATGLAFGLAANMRPAYQPALIVAAAVAVALPLRPWTWRPRAVAAAVVVAGAFVAIFPQMLITHHQRGSWSPTPPDARVIAMQQLSDGMVVQKYETFAGPPSRYPQPEVFFFDPATQHVLQEEHLSTNEKVLGQYDAITSYSQYLGIVVRHPFELAASYVRRVFNGLDVRFPTPYILDLGNTSVVLSLLEYSLLFGAAAAFLVPSLRRGLGSVRWSGVVVLVSPILTVIPSEAESRFFLPLQLLVYTVVCFGLGGRKLVEGKALGRRVALAVSYVGFLLVCLALSTATQSHIEYPSGAVGLGASSAAGGAGTGVP